MIRPLCAVVVASCSHPAPTPSRLTDECQLAIRAFASSEPLQMRVLPNGCTVADLKAVFGAPVAKRRDELGADLRNLDVVSFAAPQLEDRVVHAWIDMSNRIMIPDPATPHPADPDDVGRVVLLDVDWPPTWEAVYVRVFGLPEARLDYPWRSVVLEQSELVWPSRGIVIVAGPHVKAIVRAGIFVPTTLADYEAKLRFDAAGKREIEE